MPAGQVAQLDDGLLGSPVGVVHQLAHLVEVERRRSSASFSLAMPEAHGHGDQLGLGAVVEVPLDPPQRGRRGVDGLGPGLLERAHPGRHGIGRRAGPA